MTDKPDSLRAVLTPEETKLWNVFEAGGAPGLPQEFSAPLMADDDAGMRLRLFGILACSDARVNFKAAGQLPQSRWRLFDMWRRAERAFAGYKREMEFDPGLTPADVEQLDQADPLGKLVAARTLLALGLGAVIASESAKADALLTRGRALFEEIGSSAGAAAVDVELGKLRTRQGSVDEALLFLLSALNTWGASQNARSAEVWHEIGSLLLDSRRVRQAIPIFQSIMQAAPDTPNTRTDSALTRALIADGQLSEALEKAKGIAVTEQAARIDAKRAGASHHPYREIMALRDIGEIEVRSAAAEVMEAASRETHLQNAEQALEAAAKLLDADCSDQNPIFPRWTRQIDSGPEKSVTGAELRDPNEYEKLRLVQLELMIDAFARPGPAGRNLSKLAEAFSARKEVFHEIEVREQAAEALLRAGDFQGAARQLGLAHRLAIARGQTGIARELRAKLTMAISAGPGGELAAQGIVPLGVISSTKFRTVIAAMDMELGQRVLIHRYTIPASEKGAFGKAERGIGRLDEVRQQRRVLPGLPEILGVTRKEEAARGKGDGGLSFDLVVQDVSGKFLHQEMPKRDKGDPAPKSHVDAIGVVRSLAFTIQGLHNLGITDCRPDADRVILDIGNAPIWTEALPIYEGEVRGSESDVKHLAGILVQWLGGGPGERGRKLWKAGTDGGFMKPSVFPGGGSDIPAGLEALLTAILLGEGKAPKTPGGLADELERYS